MSKSIQNFLIQIVDDSEYDNALNQIQHKLKSDFQLEINVTTLKEIEKSFYYLKSLLKQKTNDFKKNSENSEEIYKTISKIRISLNEFFNNENFLMKEILKCENLYKWLSYVYAGAYLLKDANKFINNETNEITDVEKFLNNHLEAVEIFFKSIDECYAYLEQKEIDYIEQPIFGLLQGFENVEQEIEDQYKPLVKKVIVTAKAILWDINRIKDKKVSESKPTVANLQKYLESTSGWEGDDFEECLEFVNNMRRGD